MYKKVGFWFTGQRMENKSGSGGRENWFQNFGGGNEIGSIGIGVQLESEGENTTKVNDLQKKWASLFGIKPAGKSSLPLVKNILEKDKGMFTLEILDQIIDKKYL